MRYNKIDFVWIWCEKCWTTLFAKLLSEHPEIYLAKEKEVWYFSTKNSYWGKWGESHYEKFWVQGYLKFFENTKNEKIKWEWSVNYDNKEVADILYREFPHIKILVAIRNPIKRSISSYNFNKYYKLWEKSKSFEEAIQNTKSYIEHSKYYNIIKYYIDLFWKDKVYIINLDEFQNDKEKTIKELYDFLKVESNYIPPSLTKIINPAKKSKSKFIRKFILAFYNVWPLFKKLKIYFIIDFLVKYKLHRNYRLFIEKLLLLNTTKLKKETINKKNRRLLKKILC